MAVTTFAAIDIASYDVSMEIFELTKKNGLRSLTRVRQSLELGKDTYAKQHITMEKLQQLSAILTDYKRIMKEYGVSDYRACAKSAFREARNRYLAVDMIRRTAGIEIDVLSNSEQRFLGYKSIASKGEEFQKFIEKGTAIIDVGGGSTQISIFDNDVLVMTQNILLGSLRVRERLSSLQNDTVHYDELVEQLIHKDLVNVRKMYLKNRNIENIILVGDYFTNLIFQNRNDLNKTETKAEFMEWYKHVVHSSPRDVADELGISAEMSSVLIPTATVYRKLIEDLNIQTIWLPGIQLTDGIAYDYAEKKKFIRPVHDFEQDILMAAKNIARRYASYKPHNEKLVEAADAIFEVLKKSAGLDARARLLLRVACYLHDCGKYISLVNVAECSYNIIMSTEIIGLSVRERRIIANVVRYNTQELGYYKEAGINEELSVSEYMLVSQLAAIMRIANSLDQSYLQKVDRLTVTKKEHELLITVDVNDSYLLEQGIFRENIDFFEEIYHLRPVLKVRNKGV
ncbi:MAG: HD domain-containing protein [Lachnospiraceae bacterium]|nr:HD domain-containing protein [Lachnospiraceae bacterium]